MKYKLISVAVLVLASSIAGFILFSKKTEQTLAAPQATITQDDIMPAPPYSPQAAENSATLSNAVAKAIADQLIAANPTGPQDVPDQTGVSSIRAMKPEKLADTILKNETEKATQSILSLAPTAADIHTSSSATAREYFVAREQIVADIGQKLGASAGKPFDDNVLRQMFVVGETALEKMRSLPVPQSLVTQHTEQLRLLMVEQVLFSDILNRDTDPVAATVAISLLPKFSQDSAQLNKTLTQLYQQTL